MANKKWIDDVCIENAQLLTGAFKNFSGKEKPPYNRAGDRNFAVFIDNDIAEVMKNDGWNIKTLNPRDEDEEPRHYIVVAVSYKIRPPEITLISGKSVRTLTEETVGILDQAEAINVDLIIHPYVWNVGDESGVKAYLKEMVFEQKTSRLQEKYAYLMEEESDEQN